MYLLLNFTGSSKSNLLNVKKVEKYITATSKLWTFLVYYLIRYNINCCLLCLPCSIIFLSNVIFGTLIVRNKKQRIFFKKKKTERKTIWTKNVRDYEIQHHHKVMFTNISYYWYQKTKLSTKDPSLNRQV